MKATIWNELKALGYTAQQLKAELDVSYAQVTLKQLETLLAAYQNELTTEQAITNVEVQGVDEYLSTCAIESTVATVKDEEQLQVGGVNSEIVTSVELAIKPFNYSLELDKLKELSYKNFSSLIKEVQQLTHFSSYYIPHESVIKTYFTDSEYEKAISSNDEYFTEWYKLIKVEDLYHEAGNYHHKIQLTPKLQLFSELINYTFLMRCLNDLACHYNLDNNLITGLGDSLTDTWFTLSFICFKQYCTMPIINWYTHLQLLKIHLEASTQHLECKSIYA